jgi:predicted amidophosphoribosyltransferase
LTVRVRRIDDQNRSDHYLLTADDECFFLFEYTSRRNYNFSQTNSLISNLKKRPSLQGTAQYRYKISAMNDCAAALGAVMNPNWLANATLVPVPPSKARADPEYDDRMAQICRAIPTRPGRTIDVRELVFQSESLPADHENEGQRLSVDDLRAVYRIDETQAALAPQKIGVVDDVLTNGTHFRAMKIILQNRFPGVPVVGFFIARRVFPSPFEAIAQ